MGLQPMEGAGMETSPTSPNEPYLYRKLVGARFQLYRRRFLQVNIRWKALDEIYKICKPLHRSKFKNSFKNRRQSGCDVE